MTPPCDDIAELAAKVKAGLTYHQTPAAGFAEAKAQPLGWGSFKSEAWAEAERAHAFREVGRAATKDQLQGIERGLKTVIEAFDALQMPAIQTLANGGLVREQVRPVLAGWQKIVKSALAEGLSHIPKNPGRGKEKQREGYEALLVMLAKKYSQLFGECNPNERKDGSFYRWAHDVFKAIPLKPLTNYMIENACHSSITEKVPEL